MLAKVREAYKFSREQHSGQKRKSGETFFNHPKRMYLNLKRRNKSDIILCAALLHDVVEDTDITLKDIRKKFGDEVAFIVDGLTKVKRFENTLKKIKRYSKKDRRVLLVKLADLEDNVKSSKYLKGHVKIRLTLEYMTLLEFLEKISKTKEEKEWVKKIKENEIS